jgi:phage-related protein
MRRIIPEMTMPKIPVVIYKEDEETTPLLAWLDEVEPKEAVAKCTALIELLGDRGHDLRRPASAPLEDGIYELRTRVNKVQVRMLYFFDKREAAVVTHGFIKRGAKVPTAEIERARRSRERYLADKEKHTHRED